MRSLVARLAVGLVALAACGDEPASDLPGTCGAVLGDPCDASTPCDVGLSCGSTGRCECDPDESCALACWTDRTAITEVVVDGEMLYVQSTPTAGGWDVTSVPTQGGPRRPAALGTGTAVIAGHNGDLYIAAGEVGAFDWLVTRRLPDGDRLTQIKASLSDVHGLAASARGVAYSIDGSIWLVDPADVESSLTAAPEDREPRALTFDGASDLVYINRSEGTADRVVRLAGQPATRSELGAHDEITSLVACTDALYWASPSGGAFRHDRGAGPAETVVGGRIDELACTGTTTYWIGADDSSTTMPEQPYTIGERASSGAVTSRHEIPYAPQTLVPPQLAVDASYLYWTLGAPGRPHRVMRLDR